MKSACQAMRKVIQAKWGSGWNHLGDDLKRAIVAERVLHSFVGLDESTTITTTMIAERLQGMLDYCGLNKGE